MYVLCCLVWHSFSSEMCLCVCLWTIRITSTRYRRTSLTRSTPFINSSASTKTTIFHTDRPSSPSLTPNSLTLRQAENEEHNILLVHAQDAMYSQMVSVAGRKLAAKVQRRSLPPFPLVHALFHSVWKQKLWQHKIILAVPSVLWHGWLGHLTRKNLSSYDLYCVGGMLSLTQSINQCCQPNYLY